MSVGAAPVCLIVNPAAGGGRAKRLAPQAERALRGHGLQVRRADTRDLAHARELAVEAARGGETVVVLSGDGAIGAVADALQAVPGAVLGVLPGGRGNDLARVLGISEELESACAIIALGVPRAMDVGEVLGKPEGSPATAFVGIASAGFDSDANRIANEAPSQLGGLVYAYGALRALLRWRPARFQIELDPPSSPISFSGYTVAVANSRAYGGGMMQAPHAMLDDGLLDVVAIEHVSKLRFLANLPKVFKGAHVELPTVRVLRAAEVEISADRPFTMYADGDPIGELPLRMRAVRAAVTVLTPPGAGASPAFASPPLPARPAASEPAPVAADGDSADAP